MFSSFKSLKNHFCCDSYNGNVLCLLRLLQIILTIVTLTQLPSALSHVCVLHLLYLCILALGYGLSFVACMYSAWHNWAFFSD